MDPAYISELTQLVRDGGDGQHTALKVVDRERSIPMTLK